MGEFGQFHSYKDEPGSVNSVIISFSLFFLKKKSFPISVFVLHYRNMLYNFHTKDMRIARYNVGLSIQIATNA